MLRRIPGLPRTVRIPAPRRGRGAVASILVILAGLAGAWLLELLPSGEAPIAGQARIIDGDTLAIGSRTIRLHGLDAPETRQTCQRDGRDWDCGADARQALARLVQGRPVTCRPVDRDRYGRVVARCHAGGEDLGSAMVRQGWAVAYTRYSWRYLPQEWLAWWDGSGIWSGSFQLPEEWRRDRSR